MQVSECRKIKVWHQSMTAANGSIRSSDSFCLARWPTGSELSELSWLQTCCCRLETCEKQKAYFVDRFKQTERIHILADWIKVVAFAFAFLQCCLCCRPAGLFKSFSRPRRGVEKKMEVEKKTCWGLKQDKPSARSGKRHFGVEKKSSPLQALPQAARTLRCTSNSVRLWSFKATLQEIWPCVEAPRSSK